MSTASGVAFDRLCALSGLPVPRAEFVFASPRRWRFDWAWLDQKLALEVDGGVDKIGRHQRADGFRRDREKLNAAVLRGWRVLHCEPRDLATAALVDLIRDALAAKE